MDSKITDLTSLASADSLDVIPIVDISANETKKITKDALLADVVSDTDYAANNTIVYKNSTGVIASLTVGTSTIVGRKASGEIVALTGAEALVITGGVAGNTAITAGTKTKITYDVKGLVTAGADATTSDIGEGSNLYFTEVRVRASVLTGLSISGGAITAADSVLSAFGKLQNQVNSLVGGVSYQGVWNATTNSPALASGVGTKGFYYVVSVAGATNLDGITDWKLGDWAIFNGTTWEKVDNTDAVISVNGYLGAVVLVKADVGLGNVENTALSTWAGSSNITTLGTIVTGIWNGTAIANANLANSAVANLSGTNTGDQTIAGLSPLTTKGDIFTYSTINDRLGVGANGFILTADSTQATGIKWAAAAGGSQTPWTSDINADGFVLYGNDGASDTLTLSSTSHATKGKIIFGTASAYDQLNDRFGITQTTPTSKLHIVTAAIGVTQLDAYGILIANTTAATVGAQQMSPPLIWQGAGWKTSVTSASQDVRFRADVLPVQGASNPTGRWQLSSSVNAAAYVVNLLVTSGSVATTDFLVGNSMIAGAILRANSVATAFPTYRTTNAGGDISPTFIVSNTNTAGNLGLGYETGSQLVLTHANGTRPMAGAGIGIINLDNTAGSEDSDFSISTQSAGGAMSSKMVITNDGRIYGIGIHNNAGAVTGTVNQYIASGTFTPTLTNVANLSASTAYSCQWMRVGNVVTVSGKVDLDPTLTATLTQLGISLPIASAFANIQDCGGSAFASGIVGQGAAILADAANDRAEMDFISGDITNQPMFFTFQYLVL